MKGKIFIVDDDPKIGRLLKFKLARADYDAEYFNNAAEALNRIPDLKPHLVISDIQMPHMNGYEFCEKLRQDARTASIPFIFLSGKTDTSDQLEGLRLGADDYVCKPVKINFLMERMEKVLERAARARTFKSLADFSGHLSRMTINDVMQIVEANHKTGELEFSTTDGKTLGRILFRRGNLIKAQFRELDGAEAFYGLMDEADGYFEFYARDVNEPEQITITNMAALLQGSRLIDEAKALYRHLPDLNITLNVNTSDIPHEVEDRCGRERVHRILSMLGRKLSVDEALSGSRMSRPRSASIIADLLRHNIVSIPKKEKAVLKPISAAPPRISIEAWLIKALRSIEERRATGVLEIGNLPEREMIFCQEGHIINAFHGKTTGKKALYRIFAGQGGTPRFDPYPVIVNRLVNDSLEYLIEDGNREVETLRLLRQMPFNNRIQVNQQQMEKVSRIKSRPGLKDVLALVMQHERIRDVIDASSFTDLRTYNHLLTLVKLNVIEIEKDGGTTADQA